MENNICSFCSKEFSNKVNLIRHQTTTKSCLKLQGKEEKESTIKCINCKKLFAVEYYKKHKIKCDLIEEEKNKDKEELEEENKKLKSTNQQYELELKKITSYKDKYEYELNEERMLVNKIMMELVEYKSYNTVLKEQNEKLQSISTSITMKLAEKATTVNNNNNNKTLVISTPLTNEVLRQCANTFSIDNAYNINGITKHLTSSLEEHVKCTDAARNIFKYVNEKDEEIVDQDLEILIPQYLIALKDRNNFLYKEVFEYFKKNNVSLNVQTDYRVFYDALNNIIEKTGQESKYTEKCKQYMVRECKRQFLEKNKNKEKEITKKLSTEEVMMNIIETGGSLYDYINKFFPDYIDEEETEEQFTYRREMEDMFRKKKREWKMKQSEIL
jgi:hypothetical protein